MSMVKCVGCSKLRRDNLSGRHPGLPGIVYTCSRFPYWCALSGLLKPSGGIEKTAAECPVDIEAAGCIICGSKKELTSYGMSEFAFACLPHDRAWGKWLDEHKGKRAYFAPRGRVIKSRWIEVFREFVSEVQQKNESN